MLPLESELDTMRHADHWGQETRLTATRTQDRLAPGTGDARSEPVRSAPSRPTGIAICRIVCFPRSMGLDEPSTVVGGRRTGDEDTAERQTALALTIVWHRDVKRIGVRGMLSGTDPVEVSRKTSPLSRWGS